MSSGSLKLIIKVPDYIKFKSLRHLKNKIIKINLSRGIVFVRLGTAENMFTANRTCLKPTNIQLNTNNSVLFFVSLYLHL